MSRRPVSKNLVRWGLLVAPFLGASGAIAACGDDDNTFLGSPDAGGGRDARTDSISLDAPFRPDARVDAARGDADAASADAGATADADADAIADADTGPPLCTTYPDNSAGVDAAGGEDPSTTRYDLIALRAVLSGQDVNASTACEIRRYFDVDTVFSAPAQHECLGRQLAYLAGCPAPAAYEGVARDTQNGALCAPDAGEYVQVAFRSPRDAGYTHADVDFLIGLVRQAAISTGMAAGDADRLVALLESQKSKVVTMSASADAGDGGFSAYDNDCPP